MCIRDSFPTEQLCQDAVKSHVEAAFILKNEELVRALDEKRLGDFFGLWSRTLESAILDATGVHGPSRRAFEGRGEPRIREGLPAWAKPAA
eukprot:10522595-Alexandrium_andersonii.AAC.1